MGQVVRPIADGTLSGAWGVIGAAAFWDTLDEVTPDNDTTYSYSPYPGGPAFFRVKLGPLSDPNVHTGHTISWWIKNQHGHEGVQTQLYQGDGTTLIANLGTYTGSALTWTFHSTTLSEAQAANITDYEDLYLYFGSFSMAHVLDYVRVTWAQMEVPFAQPLTTTDAPTGVADITATLNGTLNSDGGEPCTVGFQWGLTNAYGSTTPTETESAGQTFTRLISGLTAGTIYHFRAFATNSQGTAYGLDRLFLSLNAEVLLPDSAGDNCEFSQEAGAACPNHYANVDEDPEVASPPHDSDTTYNASESTPGWQWESYNLEAASLGAGSRINSVKAVIVARSNASATQANVMPLIVIGGVVYNSAGGVEIPAALSAVGAFSTTTSYAEYTATWATNPATGKRWLKSELASLQIGVGLRRSASSGINLETRVTQEFAVVVYEPAYYEIDFALAQSLFATSLDWTDISSGVKRHHILRGRAHDLDRIETGKAEILLDNRSGYFWRGNTASPYYGTSGDVKPVTLVRITEAYAGIAYDVFYGYIERIYHSWVDEEGGTAPQTEFACVDMFKAFARMNVYPLAATVGTHQYVTGLASAAAAAQADVVLDSVEGLFAGQSLLIADDTPQSETRIISSIAPATNTVTLTEVLTNSYSAATGYVKKFPAGLSSIRIADLLYEKGFPAAMMAIDTGLVTVAAMIDAPTGTNVLEHIHDVARAESGLAFMRGDGFFVFQNRDARQTGDYATSAATLKDDGDSHYAVPELLDDDSLIYNTARVTPDNGDGTTQQYYDSTFRNLHGERLWKDDNSLIASESDAIEKALIVVERYKDSILRVSRVKLFPDVNAADLYPKVFGLEISRRVTLQLDSTQNPALIDTQYHIEGIELLREVGAPYRAWWQLWDVKKLLVAPIQYDGYLQKESLVSFADGHDAADADSALNDNGVVAVGMQKDGAADWLFWRGFLKFDISGIPTSKTAISALVLVRLNGYFVIDDAFSLTLVDGATLANPIIVNDYGDMIGATTDFGSVAIAEPAINSARYVGIPLTAAGLADLQAKITAGTGFHKFGVRSSLDISNAAPAGATNQQYVIFDGKGSADPPRLIVRVA